MAANFQYLAGLLDGEGCFAVYKYKEKDPYGYSYRTCLQMTARDLWFLEKIQKLYGGKINYMGKSRLSNNELWYLRFRKPEMLEILPKIIPHLIVKKQQAELLLEAIQITERHRFKDYNPSPLEKIVASIKQLKLGLA